MERGADAPNELGASLTGALSAPVVPPSALTVPAAPAPQVAVTAALPYRSFLRYDLQLRTLPAELQPYALSHPGPLGYGTVDAAGVRMVDRGGRLWNHPAAQAQYGIAMLESHRLTGDSRYLAIAVEQATRLIGRAHAYGGGLFHPYDFPDAPHDTTVRTPPWYSAIGQGQVLDFFTRLARSARADLGYRSEADGTFKAFLVPQVARKPWVTWVHAGQLWLDEYPRTDVALGDRTYNGHMFAAFGLYQYFLLSQRRARPPARAGRVQHGSRGGRRRRATPGGAASTACRTGRTPAGTTRPTRSSTC